MFEVKAVWTNGSGGVSAGPYTRTLGVFETEAEANEKAPIFFADWRKEYPESDGWRSNAWVEIDMIKNKNALSFKQPKLLNETSCLDFGQYEGQSIKEIMQFDASYLVWLVEKKIIDIEAILYDEIVELDFEQSVGTEIRNIDWGLGDLPWFVDD